MSDSLIPAKAKKKVKAEPLSESCKAYREYERTSYYLATIGDFDFTMDDEAKELFFAGIADDEKWADIAYLTALRLETAGVKKIPAGPQVDGLAARTKERERRNKPAEDVKSKKKATKKQVERDNEGTLA